MTPKTQTKQKHLYFKRHYQESEQRTYRRKISANHIFDRGLCLVTQSCPTVCDTMDCSPPGSSVHGIFQANLLEWIAISFSRGSSRPRNPTRVSCIVGRFFTDWRMESENESCLVVSDSLWPQGLYSSWNSLGQNTGVGSLSLLQGIFPTQGLNPGLRHCRQILYQLIHKGSHYIIFTEVWRKPYIILK